MSNNLTIIYVRSEEEAWDDRWTTKEILKIDSRPDPTCIAPKWDPELEHVLDHAAAYIQETFSDSDLDIKRNGYLTLDEDCEIVIHGTVVVLPVRDMSDDEIQNYEDARDEHAAEVARDWAYDQQFEQAREARAERS